MKSFTLILTLLISLSSWAAKPYSLEQVIGMSDLIVIGEIENVEDNTYTLKIDQTLKGDVHASIRIVKTDECERYAKYESGQKLCVFLKKGLLSWNVIDGNLGERPILDDIIYLGLDQSYKLPLNEFSETVMTFCNSFKTHVTTHGYSFRQKVYFTPIVSKEELELNKNENRFSRWLYNQVSYDELTSQ